MHKEDGDSDKDNISPDGLGCMEGDNDGDSGAAGGATSWWWADFFCFLPLSCVYFTFQGQFVFEWQVDKNFAFLQLVSCCVLGQFT